MKKGLLLLILIFGFTVLGAQPNPDNEFRGTIKVKRVKEKIFPHLVAKKKSEIRVFFGSFGGYTYKITFPKSYQADLFPLMFNSRGLVLADENKLWSDNTIIGYNYEISIGNAVGKKGSTAIWNINSLISNLPFGQFMWITGLYYSDLNGTLHRNEIGDFKIERLN